MSPSDSTSSGRNYTYVMEGFQELRRALEPFVEKCGTAEHGSAWHDHAVSVLKEGGVRVSHYGAIERDVWKLLKLMRDDPKPFSAILQSRGEQLVYKLLAIRHESHHDQELELSDASHAYDCFCEMFQLIDYPAPEFEARRVTLHSLVAQASQPPVAAAALTGDAVEGLRNGSKEAVDGRSATGQEDGTSNDDTPSPWVGDDDLDSGFSNRGSASRVFNPKKKALVVGGTIIGLLAVGGLIQLKNFQGSSRPNVLAESGSPAQISTPPSSGSGRQGPSAPITSSNVPTVSSGNPQSLIQPQLPPGSEGRTDASRGSSTLPASGQPDAADPPPTPATPLNMKAAEHGFTYELESCTASGTTVRCIFAVTNQEDDRELMILFSARHRDGVAGDFAALNAGIPGTRAIDDAGNNATMREARLANYDVFGGTLVAGVRTRLVVVFEGISASAQTLSVLDLGSRIGSRGDAFGIQFREVPLRR